MTPETSAPPTEPLSARARRRGSVLGYDFSAPARLSRDHTRLLEIAFETFGRQWATQLGTRLSCSSSVELTSVDQATYDGYVAELPTPSALVVFTLDSLNGATGVLQMKAASALAHLDHALGGPGGIKGVQPARPLTEIEVSLTLNMAERALATLGYAFTSVGAMAPTVEGLQQDSQLVQAARATEMVVVATFALQLGEHVEPVTVMIPLGPLQVALNASGPQDSLSAQELERNAEAHRILQSTLPDVPVDVAVRMTQLPVPPQRVLQLAVGDLLRLPHPASRPLEVMAADVVVAHAVPAARGNRRACLIVSSQEDPR